MLQSNFILAWRYLLKNKLQTIINIVGLVVGLSACIVIYRIVDFELGFDTHIPEKERIYRIYSKYSVAFVGFNSGVPTGLPIFVKDNFTGLESITHFQSFETKVTIPQTGADPKEFRNQEKIIIADPVFFKIINQYDWLYGSPEAAISHPFQVVLTESKANIYFGDMALDKIIGQRIVYRDSLEVTVTGILKDPVAQTDFNFTDFISYATIESSWLKTIFFPDYWQSTSSNSQIFIKMAEEIPLSNLESQMPLLANEFNNHADEGNSLVVEYKLQPLSEIHFNTEFGIFNHSRNPAHRSTLRILTVVAFFLLIIASINFINLETAQAMQRAKEVGVRKALGSSRARLVYQFLSEGLLIAFLAVLLSIPSAYFAIQYFNDFVPEGLVLGLNDPSFWGFLVISWLLVGLMSGIYPAFIISSYSPIVALKTKTMGGGNSNTSFVRKGLTIFQFTFSQILIVGTMVIGLQISYMLNKDLGFKKDGVIYFYTPRQEQIEKQNVLLNKLTQLSGVIDASTHSSPPMRRGSITNTAIYMKGNEELINSVQARWANEYYLDFYDLELIAGRNLIPTESSKEILINDTYRKLLLFEFPNDVLGEEIKIGSTKYTVVGVINDFHFKSMHNAIDPLFIAYRKTNTGVGVKLGLKDKAAGDIDGILADITKIWNETYPDYLFNYYFMDDTIQQFYETEQKTVKLSKAAMFVAILISCLGLFGLASYTIVLRTKEIGIRKVLGATVFNIGRLLSMEFLKPVFIAFLITVPISFYLTEAWLQDFAYRTSITWWIFMVTGLISLTTVLVSVGYQSLKAAIANPT
ncbi:MAG: ABC transporter permease, partial [Bacteroidetes bacterium]|nr:ABC transporter permease [Bacteroidota bacterium]